MHKLMCDIRLWILYRKVKKAMKKMAVVKIIRNSIVVEA